MENKNKNNNKLVIIWTTNDIEVALNMILMYTLNSKIRGWWKEILLIVWGPSTKLLSENTDLQSHIKKALELGIEVEACRACTDIYDVSKKLQDLGVIVKYMGEPLTHLIKNNYKIISF